MWRFLYEEENLELQISPYGWVLNTFSESETPFLHRKGNIFMIHYIVKWFGSDESEKKVQLIN
ncbi:hypothetical protein ACS0TY_000544 [Phlomoides rotata]